MTPQPGARAALLAWLFLALWSGPMAAQESPLIKLFPETASEPAEALPGEQVLRDSGSAATAAPRRAGCCRCGPRSHCCRATAPPPTMLRFPAPTG
ncbi:hypothetical protein [Frigidibacter mobilis]|uniref:hypothetical protein n=1 Tax=Frigidibacter mobilis TaxID=1335048 RepID=UPI001F370DB4|nr:hypothetical protein [Frigidibacter mobilis]